MSPQKVLAYAPPTPPKGNHRYVFSVFEQPGGQTLSLRPPMQRGGFKTRNFAKECGLHLVGATFFYAAHQDKK